VCERLTGREFVSRWTSELARGLTQGLGATYQDGTGINHLDGSNMPQSEEVIQVLHDLLEVLFPGYSGRFPIDRANVEFVIGSQVNHIFRQLVEQIERAYAYNCRLRCCSTGNCRRQAEDATIALLEALPRLRELLKKDVQAALDGDPATNSPDEVVIAYPGLKAIAINRLAHVLYQAGVPLVPRVMGEYAHAVTGIDIHPGATLGASLFIDHGTGVVVGETAVVGDNVKIYQGVTLGALSFPKDACGRIIKGAKRHPNIEDNVTLYAGATVLGDITIGHDSVIGGNVWITESVPPYTKVTVAPPDLAIRTRKPTA
jgi:serine O-acetyltransferase